MKSLFLLTLLLYLPVSGQLVPSEILAKDQAITEAQSVQIFKIVRAVTKDASEIVFPIFSSLRSGGGRSDRTITTHQDTAVLHAGR